MLFMKVLVWAPRVDRLATRSIFAWAGWESQLGPALFAVGGTIDYDSGIEGGSVAARRAADGFVEDVNGKDLSNWQGEVDSYEVQDGAITCKPGKGGDLLTKEPFENGTIRIEFKLPKAGNNGIALRTPLGGHAAGDGLELQVIDSDGYNEKMAAAGKPGLEPYQYHGSLYHCVAAKHGYLRPAGEWNFQEIDVDGQKIKVTLNGTKILDVDIDTFDRSQIKHPPKGVPNLAIHGFWPRTHCQVSHPITEVLKISSQRWMNQS